jgi:hypothetical protein
MMPAYGRWVAAILLATVGLAAGGAPAADPADPVDLARQRLGAVILANDILVEPGQEVSLAVTLRTGLKLQGVENKRLRFLLGDVLLGEVRSNHLGDAALKWKVPDKPGEYVLRIALAAPDQPAKPVADAALLVAAWPKDASIAVIDLDRTLTDAGFGQVLQGDAKAMPGAALVVQRLAKTNRIVYLAYRPDFLGALGKRWLADNAFPAGPVVAAAGNALLAGPGPAKNLRVAEIRKTYPKVAVGIGDKPSDAKAWADAGMTAVLLVQVDWAGDDPKVYDRLADDLAACPEAVQVVTNWSQIASILFDRATLPKREMEKRLRDVAKNLRGRSGA